MSWLLRSPLLRRTGRLLSWPEAPLVAVSILMIELLGPNSVDDVADIPFVLVLPLLFMLGCSVVRYRELPLTRALLGLAGDLVEAARARLVLSLGLDFHPRRRPRLPAFHEMHGLVAGLFLAAVAVFPAQGMLREVLLALRVPGLYTVYALLLGAVWAVLLLGIAVQVPAIVLDTLEVVKGRLPSAGVGRIAAVALFMAMVTAVLVAIDAALGLPGCLAALAFAALLPGVLRPLEPPGGPWLNLALGRDARPRTASLSDVIGCVHRLMALLAFLVVALLVPSSVEAQATLPVTNMLLRLYGWSAAWLLTVGALLAVTEFNRRRRLADPAFPRERVVWALPGAEAEALRDERAELQRAGWSLVVSSRLPGVEEADLLVGAPDGLPAGSPVPQVKVPPALFVLAADPGAALAEADERDKAVRVRQRIEQLLVSARPHLGDRGEGTFLVPHCWLVVGLTRDDDRSSLDRPPTMAFGQTYQTALGTRLRRFLHEVLARAGVDVIYVEDSVRPHEVGQVLERILERHVRRMLPGEVRDVDFLGLQGLRIVLHDVDPEVEGIAGVDAHLTRNAISRARILIIGRDKGDGGDDDDPPSEGESGDLWLRDALRRLFPRLQPA